MLANVAAIARSKLELDDPVGVRGGVNEVCPNQLNRIIQHDTQQHFTIQTNQLLYYLKTESLCSI